MSGGEIGLRTVAHLRVEVGAPLSLGQLNGLERRMVPILGGTVEIQNFRGIIIPGGSDIQTVHADGTVDLVARYALDLGEAGKVLLENTGIRRGPPTSGIADIRPYFRGVMRFQAPQGSLDWLNRTVFVTSGHREGAVVHLQVAEVL